MKTLATLKSLALVCGLAATLFTLGCPPPPVEGEGEGEEGEGEEGEGEGEEGAAFGAACAVNSDCASGSCTPFFIAPTAFSNFCTEPCTADANCADVGVDAACVANFCFPTCTAGGSECDDVFGTGLCIAEVGGAGTADACLKPTSSLCGKDGDCAATENCVITGSIDGITGVCAGTDVAGKGQGDACSSTAQGQAQAGLLCEVNADCAAPATCPTPPQGQDRVCVLAAADSCASIFCLEDVCTGLCDVDADCGAGNTCAHFDFGADPVVDIVGLCQPFTGSGAVCNAEADCTVAGEHCGFDSNDAGETITVCRGLDAGDVEIGEACGDDGLTLNAIEPDVGCATNFCSAGTCSQVCDLDADCGVNQVCLKFEINDEDSFGACVEIGDECETNADCTAATEVCGVTTTFLGAQKRCTEQLPGSIDGGEACNFSAPGFLDTPCFNDADCTAQIAGSACELASRTCVRAFAELCEIGGCGVDGLCPEICTANADCPAAHVCGGLNIVFDANEADDEADDQFTTIGVCVPLSGSQAACESTTDCTAPEVCTGVLALDGTVSTKCAAALPGVAVGQPCGTINRVQVACAEGACFDATPDNNVNTGVCAPLCAANADCTAPQTCQDFEDFGGAAQTVKICRAP